MREAAECLNADCFIPSVLIDCALHIVLYSQCRNFNVGGVSASVRPLRFEPAIRCLRGPTEGDPQCNYGRGTTVTKILAPNVRARIELENCIGCR
jgi:hypothetical protein